MTKKDTSVAHVVSYFHGDIENLSRRWSTGLKVNNDRVQARGLGGPK